MRSTVQAIVAKGICKVFLSTKKTRENGGELGVTRTVLDGESLLDYNVFVAKINRGNYPTAHD